MIVKEKSKKDDDLILLLASIRFVYISLSLISRKTDVQNILPSVRMPTLYRAVVIIPREPRSIF